jgi:hypothetical protein
MELIGAKMLFINKEEIVKEIIVEKKFLFWKYKRTYRQVHGEIFRYKNKKYLLCNNSKVRRYFKAPYLSAE